MARGSSSKKVQRAARAAAASRGARERRERGFPLALATVLVLGVAMVMFARASRAPAVPPEIEDHWHGAYAVYDCDRFLEPFLSDSDPDGIHSHRDGVIHIHPWNSSATGDDARLQVFFDAMGVRVTDDEISGPGIGVLEAGSDCNGQPTVIRVGRFALPETLDQPVVPDEGFASQMVLVDTYTDDFGDVRILEDLEAFTIARIPADAEIPPPPEERIQTSVVASAGNLLSEGPRADVDPTDTVPPSEVQSEPLEFEITPTESGESEPLEFEITPGDSGESEPLQLEITPGDSGESEPLQLEITPTESDSDTGE